MTEDTLDIEMNDPEAEFNAQLKAILEGAEADDTDDTSDEVLPLEEDPVESSEESEEQAETGDEVEDDSDEEVIPQKKINPKKGSKEEAAIIALKRENKRLQEEMRLVQAQKEQDERKKAEEKLKAKYVADGYDESTAQYMVDRDFRLNDMEQRVAISEFKADHALLFDKYPEAKAEAVTVMKNMKATGLTAEQICLAMFHKPENERDVRNKQAAKGQLESKADNDNRVSRAGRSASVPEEQALSAHDRKMKEMLEKTFGDGEKMSVKRYLELKAKRGL